MKPSLIVDIHLDISMNAMEFNRDQTLSLEEIRRSENLSNDGIVHRTRNTVCFPELRRGRIGVIVATQIARYSPKFHQLPGWRSPQQAWAQTQGQLAYYRAMEEIGQMKQLRSAADVASHAALWREANDEQIMDLPIGYLLSLEGADSILSWRHLEKSREDGLVALGPVHYGPGIYGHGTDDSGPLTQRGQELLREMERLGLILDVTHLCDEGLDDALSRFSGPVWASHHNCRALANWNRQLSDLHIRKLVERDAVIGMAFDAIMMVHGWNYRRSNPKDFDLRISKICEHIDHICQLAGTANNVCIGTDLDGGFGTEQTPLDLDSIADIRSVSGDLRNRGYSEKDIDGIFCGNVLRFLEKNL
jgi:membrane dipeptidase